jgi:hypothetical protein
LAVELIKPILRPTEEAVGDTVFTLPVNVAPDRLALPAADEIVKYVEAALACVKYVAEAFAWVRYVEAAVEERRYGAKAALVIKPAGLVWR